MPVRLDADSEFKSVMWGVHCLKQDLQDLSDLQEWTSLLPETPVIELPNYLLKLHKVCATIGNLFAKILLKNFQSEIVLVSNLFADGS